MATTEQPVAIVTGASGGIGLGVTQALLQRGWRVVATSRTVSNSKNLNLRLISYLWMERSARRKPL
jgi:NAD(P)-dependent dehydrogenase (short-subunit alcohol dehydrogenase family)